jgi:hypothetical protein
MPAPWTSRKHRLRRRINRNLNLDSSVFIHIVEVRRDAAGYPNSQTWLVSLPDDGYRRIRGAGDCG